MRGFSGVSLLLIDEASRVPDALYKALRPMLAVSDGDLWLISTPYGQRGFFYESWLHGGDEWLRISVPATECARIPGEFLQEERRELGNIWFRQEYLCEFVDNGGSVFERSLIEEAFDELVEPWGIGPPDTCSQQILAQLPKLDVAGSNPVSRSIF